MYYRFPLAFIALPVAWLADFDRGNPTPFRYPERPMLNEYTENIFVFHASLHFVGSECRCISVQRGEWADYDLNFSMW